MSIQNTRINLITDAILKKNLQKGLLPDSKEFIWQLEQALSDAGKNSTAFKFKPYTRDGVASAGRLNQDHEIVEQDLTILYQNLLSLYYDLNRDYQYFTTEKGKLEKEIDELENQLRQYLQNSLRLESNPYVYDTFDTTDKVDLSECQDVLVNTETNQVMLTEERRTTRRIYPKGKASFKVLPEGIDRRETTLTGNLNEALTNEDNAIWQHQVRTKENNLLTGIITYEFNEIWQLNQVDCEFITVKPFQLEAFYSLDGIEWFDLPNYVGAFEAQKIISLNFPSIPVKYFKLEITKASADEQLTAEDDYISHYLFGLNHIRFYHKQYPLVGFFQSKPMALLNEPNNYAIDELTLITDEYVPTGTDIQYEIALDELQPEWQAIDPVNREHPTNSQSIALKRMNKNSGDILSFSTLYSEQQAEAEDLIGSGLPVYRLSHQQNNQDKFYIPPRQIKDGSMRLYIGRHNWEIISFPSNDLLGIPKIEDYQGVFDKTLVQYQVILEGKNGEVVRGMTHNEPRKYLMQTSIYLKEAMTLTARPVSSDPFALYLNGELIQSSDGKEPKDVHFVFKAGWNDFTLLINGQNSTTVNGISFLLGFNLRSLSDTIFSRSQPLREVSLFELRYNTKRHDRNVFAKREVEGGWEILTNFWSPGLVFQLYYDYKPAELTEQDKVLLRATFYREDNTQVPTPVLRSYRIECT